MLDFTLGYVAPGLDNLEPTQVLDRFVRML